MMPMRYSISFHQPSGQKRVFSLDNGAASSAGVEREASWVWAGVDKTCLLALARRGGMAASRFDADVGASGCGSSSQVLDKLGENPGDPWKSRGEWKAMRAG